MKKIGLFLLLLFSLFVISSCDDTSDTPTAVVTYVDLTNNNEVLKTENVAIGSTATNWTPEKEGYIFDKWYATPSMNIEYDFTKEITGDVTIFGNFTKDVFEVDTRKYYILGTSGEKNSILFGTNWKIGEANKQQLTKNNSDTSNIYSITLDLYVGDSFQFAINDDFNNQRGFGYIEGDVSSYLKEEKSYLSNDSKKANIIVTKEGNYTFNLNTHPWADLYDTENEAYTEENKENFNYSTIDTIEVIYNGEANNAGDNTPIDIMIKGSYITAWGHLLEDEYTMTYNEDTDLYTYSHEFVAGDSFCFYNFIREQDENGEWHFVGLGPININSAKVDVNNSDVEYLDLTGGNIGTLANGTYSFTYDRNKDSIIVKYDETFTIGYEVNDTWYVSGSGATEPLKSSQFGYNLTDAQKLTKIDEYTYQITMDMARGDMFQIVGNSSYGYSHSYQDVVDPVKDGVEYFYKAEDNMACRVDGNYTITLHLDQNSPLGDTITWVRNGDIIQEFQVDYDVYLKYAPLWEVSETYATTEGKVNISVYLDKDIEFCFVYYPKGTPIEEVGSYSNPGVTITGQMLGNDGQFNDKVTNETGNNNFKTLVSGYYIFEIDFTEGAPVVNVINYKEKLPEFEAVIKGPAYNGSWEESDKVSSIDGKVEFEVTLKGGQGSNYEFGFTLYGENLGQYGEYVGYYNLGSSGDANSYMEQQANSGNNFVCTRSGKYKVVIDKSGLRTIVDFYLVD